MVGTKEDRKRAGALLGAALLGLGLLCLFLLSGEPAYDGVEAQVFQREVMPAQEGATPGELEVFSRTSEPRRAEEAEVFVEEEELVRSDVGRLAIRALDLNGFDVPFSLALAKRDESKGELQVFLRPQTVQSPWESTGLEPGVWRVCAFRLVERESGFPFLKDQTSVDVVVQRGETASLELSFAREMTPVGAIGGAIMFSDLPERSPGSRRPRRSLFRAPATMVGLWDESGRLVDTADVRGGPGDNEFVFLQLPKGDHRVGVMWAFGETLGWPSGEVQALAAPSLGVTLSSKARESFSKVALIAEDPVQVLPPKIHITAVIDGRVAAGEQTLEGGNHGVHVPPLEDYDVQWLVRAKGFKTELLSEDDLLFFAEEPSLPLSLERGGGTTVVAVPSTIAEVLVYNDPAFLLARSGGIEGVTLNRRGASLGATGPAGILVLPSVSRGAVKLVRPGAPQLLVVDENGQPLTRKLRELYVMPVAPR